MTLEQEDLVITARDLYEHLFETSVPALERDGATQTTLLNGRTLESILGTFDGEHIRIETAEAYAPCRIFDPAQPRTLALLMPLRDNQAPSAIAADAAA
jgi:DNA polymerase III sliding clamp (beta) subunit (PCNA family)